MSWRSILDELKDFDPAQDDKLQKLINLLKTDPMLRKHKVLIFTEYQSTARYLAEQLHKAGIGPWCKWTASATMPAQASTLLRPITTSSSSA